MYKVKYRKWVPLRNAYELIREFTVAKDLYVIEAERLLTAPIVFNCYYYEVYNEKEELLAMWYTVRNNLFL